MKWVYSFLMLILSGILFGQAPVHSIKGIIIDKNTRRPIPFATVLLYQTTKGGSSDTTGRFVIGPLEPGIYQLKVSSIGYKSALSSDIKLFTSDQFVNLELEEDIAVLGEVQVVSDRIYRKTTESPTSLRSLSIRDIEQDAGSNRDISRVLTSFPGVATPAASYRNDLLVRGGGPSENRFYVDGIEIPNINHFSTQGASGGPVGVLNADLIREVDFYSGAFPIGKPGKLSSMMDIKLTDGNKEEHVFEAGIGASEASFSAQGYLGKKTSYLISVRQSYLQFLFKALDLPFLPTYTDALLKVKTRLGERNELEFLYVAAWDNMKLNSGLDTVSDMLGSDEKKIYNTYLLGNLPKIKQHAYTYGMVYRHYTRKSIHTFTLSHNALWNRNDKFENNISDEARRLLLIQSGEQEVHGRYEGKVNLMETQNAKLRLLIGLHVDRSLYAMKSFIKGSGVSGSGQESVSYAYQTDLSLYKAGGHIGMEWTGMKERLSVFGGVQSEASDYSSLTAKVFDQLSPRLSFSYRLADWTKNNNVHYLRINGSAGRYYQLPSYTSLGYQQEVNGTATLINETQIRYIGSDQIALGLDWRKGNIQLNLEGFYKSYFNSPMSLRDSIPIACKGDDYGIVGNEAVSSEGKGNAYGLEFLARWQDRKRGSASASITLFKSTYEDIPSAWDNRIIVSLNGNFLLPKLGILGQNWSVGYKYRFLGGVPYTPYNEELSSLISVWDVRKKPVPDYSRYNQLRLGNLSQLDVRIDKSWYYPHWMLRCYLDIQNILAGNYKEQAIYLSTGQINPEDPQRYQMRYLERSGSTILPTIGLMIEF